MYRARFITYDRVQSHTHIQKPQSTSPLQNPFFLIFQQLSFQLAILVELACVALFTVATSLVIKTIQQRAGTSALQNPSLH